MSTEQNLNPNPNPELEYIETNEYGQTWYKCRKCETYQHSLQHFGWECANCQLKKKKG